MEGKIGQKEKEGRVSTERPTVFVCVCAVSQTGALSPAEGAAERAQQDQHSGRAAQTHQHPQ